jgi:hypothetical protein
MFRQDARESFNQLSDSFVGKQEPVGPQDWPAADTESGTQFVDVLLGKFMNAMRKKIRIVGQAETLETTEVSSAMDQELVRQGQGVLNFGKGGLHVRLVHVFGCMKEDDGLDSVLSKPLQQLSQGMQVEKRKLKLDDNDFQGLSQDGFLKLIQFFHCLFPATDDLRPILAQDVISMACQDRQDIERPQILEEVAGVRSNAALGVPGSNPA